MPEYSSTTITPADAIQLPAMNGSSGGNFTLASLKSYILSALGQANGIASLDGNGKLTSAQIPTDLDDVLVYAAYANYPATGVEGKLYIAKAEGQIHYWSGSAYVQINTPLTQSVTNGNTTEAPSSDAVYQKVLTEQTARQNADSQLDKRVTNLEQKAGDYSETRYQNAPSGVVPSSKARYGIWTTQRGVTRGWNQLVDDNTSTVTLTNGHKYLTYISGSYAIATGDGSSISVTGGTDCVYDLTLLGASDTSSVASVLAQFPQLGQYNSHDAGSLVSNTISGLTAKPRNVWDEVTELGDLNGNTGEDYPDSNRLRSANYIAILPSKTYYANSSVNMFFCYYDADQNFISSVTVSANDTFTTPSNAFYCRFSLTTAYGTTYNHDIMISVGSTAQSYAPWWPPVTLSLPSSVTLRSAGSVQDTDELNVEVLVDGVKVNKRRRTTKIGTHIFSNDDTWGASTISGHEVYSLVISDCVGYVPVGADKLPTCAIYKPVVSNYLANLTDQSVMYMVDYMGIYVRDDSCADISALKAKLNGLSINYELATPVVTLSDPIEDNLIYTESGGTLTPVQTQTPTIDTDFTMGFLAI